MKKVSLSPIRTRITRGRRRQLHRVRRAAELSLEQQRLGRSQVHDDEPSDGKGDEEWDDLGPGEGQSAFRLRVEHVEDEYGGGGAGRHVQVLQGDEHAKEECRGQNWGGMCESIDEKGFEYFGRALVTHYRIDGFIRRGVWLWTICRPRAAEAIPGARLRARAGARGEKTVRETIDEDLRNEARKETVRG